MTKTFHGTTRALAAAVILAAGMSLAAGNVMASSGAADNGEGGGGGAGDSSIRSGSPPAVHEANRSLPQGMQKAPFSASLAASQTASTAGSMGSIGTSSPAADCSVAITSIDRSFGNLCLIDPETKRGN